MDELVEESDDVRARTAQMRARLGRLERADYRHEEDLEYDEYEQEESKRLLSVRKDLDRKAQDHEGFARDVSTHARTRTHAHVHACVGNPIAAAHCMCPTAAACTPVRVTRAHRAAPASPLTRPVHCLCSCSLPCSAAGSGAERL